MTHLGQTHFASCPGRWASPKTPFLRNAVRPPWARPRDAFPSPQAPRLPLGSVSLPLAMCWLPRSSREEARPQKRPVPAPYPRVSSEAVGAGLNTPWNSFSLQSQPVSLAPWPLRVMLFTVKIRFIRYTVPLARRPGSLCSFLWLLIRSGELSGQGQSNPSRVLPRRAWPRRGEWLGCSSWKDPLSLPIPWCSGWPPALGSEPWHLAQHLTSGPSKQPLWERRPRETCSRMQGREHLPLGVGQAGLGKGPAHLPSFPSSFRPPPPPSFPPQTLIKQIIFTANVSPMRTACQTLCWVLYPHVQNFSVITSLGGLDFLIFRGNNSDQRAVWPHVCGLHPGLYRGKGMEMISETGFLLPSAGLRSWGRVGRGVQSSQTDARGG